MTFSTRRCTSTNTRLSVMRRSFFYLSLALLIGATIADLTPFFDPTKGGNVRITPDGNSNNDGLPSTPIARRLQELKAQARRRRRENELASVASDASESAGDRREGLRDGPTRGKEKFDTDGGDYDYRDGSDYDSEESTSKDTGKDGSQKSIKSSKNSKGSKTKGKKQSKGSKKLTGKKTRRSKKGDGDSSDDGSYDSYGSYSHDEGSSEDSDDSDEYEHDEASLEFVMVRHDVGTPDADNFGLGSGIGFNGEVFQLLYNDYGGRDVGNEAIGVHKGYCTVVSLVRNELLCTYEVAFYTSGYFGLGAVIAKGPVAGAQHSAIVTGAEYDFAQFKGGTLTTLQDPELPLLYAYLDLE